ncbi:phytase [Xylariaceae sp. FL1651]|nr:phytase [Xylariaceae sp. FL1651]
MRAFKLPAAGEAFVLVVAAVDLPIAARTDEVESDWMTVFYNENSPILIGNDGGAASGGFRTFALTDKTPLVETKHETPGRTKLVTTVYGVDKKDLIVTIAQPDSFFRLYDANTFEQVGKRISRTLGDRSALCAWRSQSSGEQYLFLFATYGPIEIASSCAVFLAVDAVYFSGDKDPTIYAKHDVTGLATYVGKTSNYLLVAQKDAIAFCGTSFNLSGVYQGKTRSYSAGVISYAVKSGFGTGFGISTPHNPRKKPCRPQSSVCSDYNSNGFCAKPGHLFGLLTCSCFAGFAGNTCESYTCRKDCSGHSVCIGANQCNCDEGLGGLNCGFKAIKAVAETDANGSDCDDPAIWISLVNKTLSRVITTTKSEIGAGFGVFDLTGKKLQTITAGEPNNVDVIYNFHAGDRFIDPVYVACREGNTLCLFEMNRNGTLVAVAGGVQHTNEDYDVYGSYVYRSRITGKQYLFVNTKTTEYLQYELSRDDNARALQTNLVRNSTRGSGGQTEGCVADEANSWVVIGEEPHALRRYGAEPDDDVREAFLIDEVGDGHMYADVEGVTLIEGATPDDGFILVSQQGVSAYNVYRRAAPHEYFETFTIYENTQKGIDAVTNTDGIAAVGTSLGSAFPFRLVVVHNDTNQLPRYGTSDEASFKLVSLGDVLYSDLLNELDPDWDPRTQLTD